MRPSRKKEGTTVKMLGSICFFFFFNHFSFLKEIMKKNIFVSEGIPLKRTLALAETQI